MIVWVFSIIFFFFSDEARFSLKDYVSSQNNHWWSAENPNCQIEKPLHSGKIGVWCGISRNKIIGPLFFTHTINSQNYHELIRQFISLLYREDRNF